MTNFLTQIYNKTEPCLASEETGDTFFLHKFAKEKIEVSTTIATWLTSLFCWFEKYSFTNLAPNFQVALRQISVHIEDIVIRTMGQPRHNSSSSRGSIAVSKKKHIWYILPPLQLCHVKRRSNKWYCLANPPPPPAMTLVKREISLLLSLLCKLYAPTTLDDQQPPETENTIVKAFVTIFLS